MLAHNIKKVLELAPEAIGLVKQASLEEEFPLTSRDNVIASYLVANYLEKVASRPISEAVFALIKKAVDLYEINDIVEPLVAKLCLQEKAANHAPTLAEEESRLEGELSHIGFYDLIKTAEAADSLYKKFGESITSEYVKRYACEGFLNKQAAVVALVNRYKTSGNTANEYIKLARCIESDDVSGWDKLENSKICKTISLLDKRAGLDLKGFNIYSEAIFSKEAGAKSLKVTLAGKEVPYEHILKFGKDRIGSLLGSDISDNIKGNPYEDKCIIESLPRDLQQLLYRGISGAIK